MADASGFTVEYLDPPAHLDAEDLPEEFSASRLRRSLLIVGGLAGGVAAALVLLPGLGSLRQSFEGAEPGWIALAAGLQVLSCGAYVFAFRAVFCNMMSWRTSTQIGLAELAANSVFSAGGAGGLALGAWILRRGGVPGGLIARRTVAFFLLTSLPNVTLLAIGGLVLLATDPEHPALGVIPAVAGVLAIVATLAARRAAAWLAQRSARRKLAVAAGAIANGVDEALALLRGGNLALIGGAMGYLVFDIASLGVCFPAFGNELPPVDVLVVAYLIGQLGGLIPIPGGIGGSDGGLIGMLVVYGVDPTSAAVAVIAYRGLLLTIPALLGLPALAVLRRRLRSESHDIAACAPGEAVDVLGRGTVVKGMPAAPRSV